MPPWSSLLSPYKKTGAEGGGEGVRKCVSLISRIQFRVTMGGQETSLVALPGTMLAPLWRRNEHTARGGNKEKEGVEREGGGTQRRCRE